MWTLALGLLRVPWTARRPNQSILKEISPAISLEGVMLKLKLQYFATSCEELTHWKRLWCWEGLGAGGGGDDRGWDGWMASLTRWTWVWLNSGSWWWTGRPGVLRFMGSQRVRHDWATELNWTDHVTLSQLLLFSKKNNTCLIKWSEVKWSETHSVVSDSLQPHGLIVHGILQARTLEWVAFLFSRGSSQPRDRTQVSHIAGGFFTSWATRKA